jgi:spermidine synthase
LRCYFAFFVASGFCSILYELIWVRLAMAEFGVTAAMISIVLSMFMAGLAGGSWLTGTLLLRYRDGIRISPLYLYAATELLIACSVLVVPQPVALFPLWTVSRYSRQLMITLFPLWTAGRYRELQAVVWLILGITPFTGMLGFLTPMLMDRWSEGDPGRAGRAYAIKQTSIGTETYLVFSCDFSPGGALCGAVRLLWARIQR